MGAGWDLLVKEWGCTQVKQEGFMVCYRDQMYCPHHEDCSEAETSCEFPHCTDEIRRKAKALGLPVGFPGIYPECYKSSKNPLDDKT